MPYLFYDTETTGLPKARGVGAHQDHTIWPMPVEIGWIVTDDELNILKEISYVIRPESWKISSQATKIHGISQKDAEELGQDLKFVLQEFQEDYLQCNLVISHNLEFDENVMLAAFKHCKIKSPLKKVPRLCTMRTTTELVGIVNNWGKYKWPKLAELYYSVIGIPFEETHRAINDTAAVVEIVKKLVINNYFNPDKDIVPINRMAMRFYKDVSVPRKKGDYNYDKYTSNDAEENSGCLTAIVVIIVFAVLGYLFF